MISFEDNMPLVTKTYNLYFNGMNRYYDDLIQCGYIGLWKACKNYNNTKKANFSTFAIKCIKNEMAQFLKKELKHWYYCTDYVITTESGERVDLLEILGDENDIEEAENKIYIESITNVKNGEVLRMCLKDMTRQEIGNKIGMTHQAVTKIIKESRASVREKMQ